MKRLFCGILIFCFVFSFFTGCSSIGGEGEGRVVAEVGRYKMTVEDLKYKLQDVPPDSLYLLETEEGRIEYMDRLLEKEVLLQEAQRQGLHREKDFMKTIERYWEQALLKLLLERKSKEISALVRVYDDEIKEYYEKSGEKKPFWKLKDDIKRAIRQEKETRAMDEWVEQLKSAAYIKINEYVLEDIFLDQWNGGDYEED